MNHERFNNMIEKFDKEIGEKSSQHEDTLLANSLVILRGKELRTKYRNTKIKYRYREVYIYLKKEFPNAQIDLISNSLMREGFINPSLIVNIQTTVFLTSLFSSIYYIIFILDISEKYDIIPAKFGAIILAVIFSAILPGIIEIWLESKSTSYFGLGHKRK